MARIPENSTLRTSEKFQKRMIFLLSEQDLNRNEFAKAAGINKEIVTRATVYGIVPSVKSLIKLADYLQVSISYLLGENNDDDFYLSENPSNFHKRLEQLANENGVTYATVSNKMRFAKNSIYEWIRTGSLPSLEYAIELSEYFDVSIDYLLGRTDVKK